MTLHRLDSLPFYWRRLESAVKRCQREGCTPETIRARDMALADWLKAADEEKLMGIVLDAGAEDLRDDGSAWEVVTQPEKFEKVRDALVAAGIQPVTAEISMLPQNYIKLTGAQAAQMLRLVEALEDLDDVQRVFANFDIDEKEIQAAVAAS